MQELIGPYTSDESYLFPVMQLVCKEAIKRTNKTGTTKQSIARMEALSKEYWEYSGDSETQAAVVNDVEELINELLPDNLYAGAHPGDPCCWGVWEVEDEPQ